MASGESIPKMPICLLGENIYHGIVVQKSDICYIVFFEKSKSVYKHIGFINKCTIINRYSYITNIRTFYF